MTREEREDAIEFFEEVAKKDAIYAHYSKLAIEALNQEPVLDRIKFEIAEMPKTYPFVDHIYSYVKVSDIIKIIDKHRSEDEIPAFYPKPENLMHETVVIGDKKYEIVGAIVDVCHTEQVKEE